MKRKRGQATFPEKSSPPLLLIPPQREVAEEVGGIGGELDVAGQPASPPICLRSQLNKS